MAYLLALILALHKKGSVMVFWAHNVYDKSQATPSVFGAMR